MPRPPRSVALGEHLPEPGTGGVCTECRRALYYQMVWRPKYPQHFYFCRCGALYAAWERWSPEQAADHR
jgi:hypothetical protein